MKRKLKRKQYMGLLFIMPWVIGFLVLQLYPLVSSFYFSLTEYNIMSKPEFIGLQNYKKLLTADNDFWNSLRVTVIYTVFTVPGKLIVALMVAMVMNKNMKGINAIRTIYYLPSLFGGSIAVSILWKLMFQDQGIVNSILNVFHIPSVQWLGSTKMALPTIILLNFWQFGSLPGVSQFEYYRACQSLFESLPTDIAYNLFIQALKLRTKIDIAEYSKIPYELKFLIYFSNYKKSDYAKLCRFLNA